MLLSKVVTVTNLNNRTSKNSLFINEIVIKSTKKLFSAKIQSETKTGEDNYDTAIQIVT